MKKIDEACAMTAGIECLALNFEHSKEYGCIAYDANTETAFLMEFDSVAELAEFYGTDTSDWLLDQIEVGQFIHDKTGFVVRIW